MVTQWPHRQRGTLSSFVDCHVPHFPAALLGNIAGRCPAFSFPCIIQHSLRQQTRAGRCLLKALEHRKPNTETANDIALPPHLILALLVRIRTVLAQRELGGHPLTPFDDRRRPSVCCPVLHACIRAHFAARPNVTRERQKEGSAHGRLPLPTATSSPAVVCPRTGSKEITHSSARMYMRMCISALQQAANTAVEAGAGRM